MRPPMSRIAPRAPTHSVPRMAIAASPGSVVMARTPAHSAGSCSRRCREAGAQRLERLGGGDQPIFGVVVDQHVSRILRLVHQGA